MSIDLVNIRIGLYHLHIEHGFRVRVGKNEAHRGYPHGFFAVYEFFGWSR